MSRIETDPFMMHVPPPKPDDLRLTVRQGDVDGFELIIPKGVATFYVNGLALNELLNACIRMSGEPEGSDG